MPKSRFPVPPITSTDVTKANNVVIVVDQNRKQWSCTVLATRGTVIDAQTDSGIKFFNVKHINNVSLEAPPYWRGLTDLPGDGEEP